MVLFKAISTSLPFPLLLGRLLSEEVLVLLSSLSWFCPAVLSIMPSSSISELSVKLLGPPNCCLDLCSA